MVSLEKAVRARLETHGHKFEILVDPDAALKFRSSAGKEDLDWDQALASEFVFKDAEKGDQASEHVLQEVFETTNVHTIAKRILLKGEVQLTTEQRRDLTEKKRKMVVATIVRNAINPQTNAPHPPQRIETAMEEAKVHIDPFKPADEQVQMVLNAIKILIPIRFQKVSVAVHLPANEVGKAYGFCRGFGALSKEEWQKDGSWVGVIEMPAGMQPEFYDKLNEKTHGNVETKLIQK